ENTTMVSSIQYLDEQGEIYKVADLDDNGNTKKITYKNTTKGATNIAMYVITYVTVAEDGEAVQKELREYYDLEGNKLESISPEDEQVLSSLEQSRTNPLEYVFEVNDTYEFKMLDRASNIAYKSLKVDYIENDTKILASDITYNITKLTNQNVEATINPYIIYENGNKERAELVKTTGNINSPIVVDTNNTHVFTENGEYTFNYRSQDDEQNLDIQAHKAKVTWIDKVAPTAKVEYSTKETTDKEVIATLVGESEEIIVTNNATMRNHTFAENGTFTFEFEDKAGNKGTATAKVTWIKKNQGGQGSSGGGSSSSVKKGDVDGDGEITAYDLALVKLHLIDIKTLTGRKFTAADIDGDGEITTYDLAKIKLHLIDLIKIK
ncbi:MAG: dockerin type I repeat-containing protein, partial [Clostridia bacterium]|nr:dockerin type I repeat-containing protein [Clostridia bacterium]